jgi:signal transduction histidine kinase
MLRIPFCICIFLLFVSGNLSKGAAVCAIAEFDIEIVLVLDELPIPSFDFNLLTDFEELTIKENSQSEPKSPFTIDTDLRSLLLGIFFGLMAVMAIYNLLLYFSLKDKAYLLYVGTATFTILTTLATNGISGQYFWPDQPDLDGIIYITFAGLSMFCSSRFTAIFLELKRHDKRLDQFMWVIACLSLLLSVLSLFLTIDQITLFGRWLVLLSFPSYMAVAVIAYRKGFKPALFYIIAWVPYVLGLVIRTMHGAGWLPTNQLVLSSLELGGALEIVLLSFALAYRIKGMKRELIEKELEKEQFKTKLLIDQKVVLEQQVDERTKALSEANATKDKFFSIIAHDLRSPMIALQGVGQKLEYFIRKDKQVKLLEMGSKIDQSIDQLNHLLNNLLNWATSQSGAIPHHPERIKIKGLINENITLYRSLIQSKEINIVDKSLDLDVYSDINATSTIVRNILSNAIKFTKQGGTIEFTAEKEGNTCRVTIKDEGPGMDEKTLTTLFGTDVKATPGTRGEKGFGLGLQLCREFAEMNGGSVEATSEVGLGSQFKVLLPSSGNSEN